MDNKISFEKIKTEMNKFEVSHKVRGSGGHNRFLIRLEVTTLYQHPTTREKV